MGEIIHAFNIPVGKSEWKRPLIRPRFKKQNNIK
jgi:hypothetical protein